MSIAQKVAKNATSMVAADVTTKIIAFIVVIYLARYLGVENFGKYNFAIAYLTFFRVLSGLGLDVVVIKNVARKKELSDEIMGNGLSIRIISSIATMMIAILLINLLGYPNELKIYVTLLSLTILFQGISYLLESLFQANLKMKYYAISTVFQKIISAVLAFILIYIKAPLIYFFISLVVVEVIRTIIDYHYSQKITKFSITIDVEFWKKMIKDGIPFFLGAAFYIIYYRIDVLMLSYMKSDLSVGFYSAAYKLTDPLLFLPTALSSTLMPIMSKKYIEKRDSLKNLYKLTTRYIFVLMFPISVGIYALASQIILLVFGKEYLVSSAALQITVWSLFFSSFNSIQSSILISMDEQKINCRNIGICCVANIIFNLVLIPPYDYIGAAWATLISVIILFILNYSQLRKNSIYLPLTSYAKPIIASTIMFLAIEHILWENVIISIICSMIIYLLLMIITKGFNTEDLNIIKKILKMP